MSGKITKNEFSSNLLEDVFTSKRFKYEEKTINAGNNSFTLTNLVGQNDKLIITDLKYGQEWLKDIHYTRSGQVITLTEMALDETLTFRIINLG